MTQYKHIYIKHFGKIPKDQNGRTYEIHHIDGNHSNNCVENLKAVSIQEHFDIHYSQGDYNACVLIAKRMKLPKEYLSNIQKGKTMSEETKRKIGEANKGNKSRTGQKWSIEMKTHFSKIRKGKVWGPIKITQYQIDEILTSYKSNVKLENIGKKLRNGKVLTYKCAFSKFIASKYNVTPARIRKIIDTHETK